MAKKEKAVVEETVAVVEKPQVKEQPVKKEGWEVKDRIYFLVGNKSCLLYTSPSPRDRQKSRMPSSA